MFVRFAIDPEGLFENGSLDKTKKQRLLNIWRQYGILVAMDTEAWSTAPPKVSETEWKDAKRIFHLNPPSKHAIDRSCWARKLRFADLDSADKAWGLIGKLDLILLDSVRAQEMGLIDDSEICVHVPPNPDDNSFVEIISRWEDIDQTHHIINTMNLHGYSIPYPDKPENIWDEHFKLMFDYSGNTVTVIDRYIAREPNRSALVNFLQFLSKCKGSRCTVCIFSTDISDKPSVLQRELHDLILNSDISKKKISKVQFFVYPDTNFQHDRRIILSNRVLEVGLGLGIFAPSRTRTDKQGDHVSFSIKSICAADDKAKCTGCEVHKFSDITEKMKTACSENGCFTIQIT